VSANVSRQYTGSLSQPGRINQPRPSPVSSQSYFLAAAIFLAPSAFLLTPFLPDYAQHVLIALRMILLPLAMLFLLPTVFEPKSLFLFIAFSLLVSIDGFQRDLRYSSLIFLSMVGSIVLFRAGHFLAEIHRRGFLWRFLINGLTAVNVATIAVLLMVVVGLADLAFVYTLFGRDNDVELGVFRFSLGNAIMTPFAITALLYAAIRNAEQSRTYLFATSVNLATAFITESRFVFLIAFFIFLRELKRAPIATRLISVVVLLLLTYHFAEFLTPIFNSLWERLTLGARDHGSAEDRAGLAWLVVGSITPWQFIVGEGFTSAARLVETIIGEYRTVESLPLQTICELGVIGSVFWLIAMVSGSFKGMPSTVVRNPLISLVVIQMVVFLPVHDLMPLTFFALGALCTKNY
jgi:hypothetical protein